MARILIVEDRADVRMTFRDAIETEGHEVHDVEDGTLAIEWLGRDRADLMIIDLVMPNLDGFEAIRQIRRIASDMPILAVTGGGWRTDLDYPSLARACGANAAVAKPVAPHDLLRIVDELLSAVADQRCKDGAETVREP